MRILVFSTSSNNVHTWLGSLESLGEHEVATLFYDQKFQKAAFDAVNATPQAQAAYQQHGVVPFISRDDAAMDDEMLMEAKMSRPDLIIYISAWQGMFVPLNDTLGELNQIAPVVHFLCDAADPPWWPQLKEFERRGQFSLTVAIDGAVWWPGIHAWGADGWRIKNALTLLTPVDPRPFAGWNPLSFAERPYGIGYAGGSGTHTRNAIVERLQAIRGFKARPRDMQPNSYPAFADFLKNTRVSVSVPFTGSGVARHVKGRVLEVGHAGGCLLEWKNEATAHWFTERHEYWSYDSVEECAEYAEYLAAKPKLAGEMAAALKRRVEKDYSARAFWSQVFAGVGK